MNPNDTTALAKVEHQPTAGIVRSAGDIVEALQEYQKIQGALDKSMPKAIMTIRGKQFRKKQYWRAIATAFNLDVTRMHEERTVIGDDWGYLVTYRATAPNGRSADGDGSCFASEKLKGKVIEASTHNVRSHAHTRAFNRAVSNLVGFGEVSAEEVEADEHGDGGSSPMPPDEPGMNDPPSAATPWRGRITGVTMRSGESKRGPWTLYTIAGEGGAKFATFDRKHAEFAKEAGASPVRIDWERSEKGGKNVVTIGPSEAA